MVNHRLMSHQKDKPSTSREYHCGFCANHDLKVKKTNHRCGYMKCPCILCNLTRTSQNIMKKQQAVWRELNARINKDVKITGMQYCDKCRNHSILTKKRYHKPCSFESCTCKYCFLTDTRRKFMRLVQRIKRANVTCQALTGTSASHQSYSIVGDDSNVTDSIKLALADAYRAMTNLPYFNCDDGNIQLVKDEHNPQCASNYNNKTECFFGSKKEEDIHISKQKRKSGSSSDVNIKKICTPTTPDEPRPDYRTDAESSTTNSREINSMTSKESTSEPLGNSLNEIPQNYFAPLMNGIENASLTEEYSFDSVLNESQGNNYSTVDHHRSSTNDLGGQQQCDDYVNPYSTETATSMNSGSSTSCASQINKFFEINNDSQKNVLESSYCSKSDSSTNIEKSFDSNFSLSSPAFSNTISTTSLLPDSYQQIIVQNIQPSSYLDAGQVNNEYKSNHPVSNSTDKDVKPDISDVKTSVEEMYNLAQFSQNAINVNSLNFEDITADSSSSLNYNVPDNTIGQSNTLRDGNDQASTNKKEHQLFPPFEMLNDNLQKNKAPDILQSNLIEVGISKQSNPSYMQANYRDSSFVNNVVIPYADITHSNFIHHNFRQVDNVADRRSFLPNRDYNPYLNISDVPFATTYQNTSHCSDVIARNKTANSSFSHQSGYLPNSTLYNPQCFNFASDSTSGASSCKVISMNSQVPSFGNYQKMSSMHCPNIDGIQSLQHNSSRNYGCVDASNQLSSNKATVAALENQNSQYSPFAYSQNDARFSVQSHPHAFGRTRQQYDKSISGTHPPYGSFPRYPPVDQQSTGSSGSGSLNLVTSGSKNSPLGKLKSMSRSFLSK